MNTDYFSIDYFIVFFIVIINILYIHKKSIHQKKVRRLIEIKIKKKDKLNITQFEIKEIEKEKLRIEKKKLNFLVDNSVLTHAFDEYVIISEKIEEDLNQKVKDLETHIKDIESILINTDSLKDFNNYYLNEYGNITFTKEEK